MEEGLKEVDSRISNSGLYSGTTKEFVWMGGGI
jgi:hypothetical protein